MGATRGFLNWRRCRKGETHGAFTFIEGNGKWDGLCGGGVMHDSVVERADEFSIHRWEMQWAISQKPRVLVDVCAMDGSDACYDTGYVFSNPHIPEAENILKMDSHLRRTIKLV